MGHGDRRDQVPKQGPTRGAEFLRPSHGGVGDLRELRLDPRHGDEPDLPDVDLFLRSSGEQRISNFLLWQSAYAEMIFMNVLWPDVDRRTLWEAVEEYARRDRRYGGAVDAVANDK